MTDEHGNWETERGTLMTRRISELGLSIRDTPVERLVDRLYEELAGCGLGFRPPVYLSDQWGCPDGTPLIGVPFYLADARLARIEEEMSAEVEGEEDSMRFLRHEAGHAFNYAYRLYERDDWKTTFGSFAKPYRERYRVDPLSRSHVRHVLGWYAQKHPDEDFAETFAVWLTPGSAWRERYADWPALTKLEYVDRVMREVGGTEPSAQDLWELDLPVEAMHYTVADHYRDAEERFPIEDARQFDGDLRQLFVSAADAPSGELASLFMKRHRREIVGRLSYWSGESPSVVRQLIDTLIARAEALELRVRALEASTLIELTAFGTAVLVHYRVSRIKGTRAARMA